jgi:hypothetical protein
MGLEPTSRLEWAISADTDNNEDDSLKIRLDSNRIAHSEAGDSDDSTYTSQSVVELQPVSAGTHSIDTRESHEWSQPNWLETTVVAIEIPK